MEAKQATTVPVSQNSTRKQRVAESEAFDSDSGAAPTGSPPPGRTKSKARRADGGDEEVTPPPAKKCRVVSAAKKPKEA